MKIKTEVSLILEYCLGPHGTLIAPTIKIDIILFKDRKILGYRLAHLAEIKNNLDRPDTSFVM